ncbi:MAG: tannase/feruloyl esterase family alpha/beta hydrolase [Pigmentiphaga sp.]|uniref:tannase/feruloyl esterase family alpha/beta hydrolase n=1 Tax=Pigmentiphaga sp. TaxID=1977564 RepID=UPI0029BC1CB6|nr:tannase/feruloyl esterase family alpha/beta hydrolase [Pigmentiphaga sp.]MDX3907209.1 tannase/feruloyl esterase family alpha/beta hydrolase [Pigmentiphaga sp.]
MPAPCPFPARPLLLLATLAALAACGGGDDAPAGGDPSEEPPAASGPPYAPALACASLGGRGFAPSQLTLPSGGAVVSEAAEIAADAEGNTLGAYCRIRGAIKPVNAGSPDIHFALNLPLRWNGKTIHFGGGGFNGRLIDGTETIRFGPADKPAPLALGYATYGDDSGHQSGSITDGKFAADDEALANYGGQSLKKTRDVAAQLVQAYYGRAPRHAYFLGTSTGGRDALAHIQRWPADYDGVIANEPALNYSGTRLSNVALGRALYANGGAGWINVAKTLMVQNTVKQACDKLDGAADGIVSNVESCRLLNAANLAAMRCPSGTDEGDHCLSDPQVATIRTLEAPLEFSTYRLANDVMRAGGYNILEGALVAGPYTSRDLGTRRTPGNPATSADANMYVTGDQWVKYFVTRSATFDTLDFDPQNPGPYTARVQAVSAITDATDADLRPFLSRGGKLIMLHGLADEVISPNSTIDYYQRVVATVGREAADQGVRFYTVPGMGHGTGVFIPNWDSLAALESWVEQGLPPATPVAADAVAGTYGRTRPLCQYPAWPKYRGSGSLDAAVNYSCVQETGDPLACPYLPAAAARYKGGNALGEELTVTVDPASMRYMITIDASLQRAPGTVREGGLRADSACTYTSDEGGAIYTFGAGGVLQGGVLPASGSAFAPLLAFASTFENIGSPTVFNPVAAIYNLIGVHYGTGGAAVAYQASGRLRNAGTFQLCQDPVTGGFMTYDAACSSTRKGYITYNAGRRAFDLLSTPPGDPAATSGGTPAGSMVIGLVNGNAVPLQLVRESETSYGLRLYAPQQSLASGAADGSYALSGTGGQSLAGTLSGATLDLGGGAAAVTYDTPVPGIAQAGSSGNDYVLFTNGILGYASRTGAPAIFATGVRH